MSFEANLERVLARHKELEAMLSSASDMTADQIAHVSKELAELAPIAQKITELRDLQDELDGALAIAADAGEDAEFQAMAKAEVEALSQRLPIVAREVERLLLPRDEADEKNAILEVRAGTGGDEAALFAANLFAMYLVEACAQTMRSRNNASLHDVGRIAKGWLAYW